MGGRGGAIEKLYLDAQGDSRLVPKCFSRIHLLPFSYFGTKGEVVLLDFKYCSMVFILILYC